MRIPVVQNIRIRHAAIAATLLITLQQIEHTGLLFSLLCGLYVLLSVLAFNAAGGLVYASGCWIFANAVLTAILALFWKACVTLEPGDSNLRVPVVTLSMYCAGMFAVGCSAALVRRIRPRNGVLADMGFGDTMRKAALGSFILGVTIQLVIIFYGSGEEGSLASAVRQINYFPQMAILLATFHQVKKTNGKSSTNALVWVAILWAFFFGVISFSKEGMLGAPVTWFAAAVIAGKNFTRKQLLLLALMVVFVQMYLVPFSQVGRNSRLEEGTFGDVVRNALPLFLDLQGTRTVFLEGEKEAEVNPGDEPHFFNRPQGFLDRLNMLAPDDALAEYTEQGNLSGLQITQIAFLNIIPHFIWKSKPFYYVGNMYARDIGMVGDEDYGTGVSFSPAGDAFHQDKWIGVLAVLPLIMVFTFLVMDSLGGDLRKSPWGLLFAVISAHAAPEGMIGGQVWISTYAALGVTLVALISKYVLPVVTGAITNMDRTRVRRGMDFRPALVPRRSGSAGTPAGRP